GGPIFRIQSSGSPYLHYSWSVSLFDLVRERVEGTIGNDGISFGLTYQVLGVGALVLQCKLKDWQSFGAGADLDFGVDVPIPIDFLGIGLGSIRLKTTIDAHTAVALSVDHFGMDIDGSFDFEGLTLSFPTIHYSES